VTRDELDSSSSVVAAAVAAFQSELLLRSAETRQLAARVQALEERANVASVMAETKPNASHDFAGVGADGKTSRVNDQIPRRLSSTPSYLALTPIQVNEFSAGNQCPNLGSSAFKQVLPVHGGSVTWDPSPIVDSDELELTSVNADWSTNQIQRIPAPYKVVHDASCSNPPRSTCRSARRCRRLPWPDR
jgi:hypothetical protein